MLCYVNKQVSAFVSANRGTAIEIAQKSPCKESFQFCKQVERMGKSLVSVFDIVDGHSFCRFLHAFLDEMCKSLQPTYEQFLPIVLIQSL